MNKPSFLPLHSALITTEQFKLLSLLRVRLERSQMHVIGPEELRQHIGIERIALGAAHPITIPHSIQRLGLTGKPIKGEGEK